MRRAPFRMVAAAALLLGTIRPAAAATYRWIDEDGVINLTNNQARFEAYQRRANPSHHGLVTEPPPRSSASRAHADTPTARESADLRRRESVTTEVMRLSGLDFQMTLLAMMVRGEFERWRSSGFRPAGAAVGIVTQAFNADTLRGNMHQFLARSLDHERADTLLAWLRTPLSLRIVSLEIASSTLERQQDLVSFINQLPSSPPPPARLTLIHRLERAGDVTRSSAIVMTAAAAALRRTLGPFGAPAGPAPDDTDGQQVGPTIDESYRLRTMLSLLFTYDDLSDAELGRYVAVLESPSGRWFTQLSRSAFLAALEPLEQPKRTGIVTAAGKRAR